MRETIMSKLGVSVGLMSLVMSAGSVAFAQLEIAPPTVTPAPASQPASQPGVAVEQGTMTSVATQPSTQASPDRMLENLLHRAPAAPDTKAMSGPAIPSAPAPGASAAPNPPTVTRLRDGQYLSQRTGRLVKDEKTGQWMFAFDSDGKEMKDPPMVILPNLYLQSMEQMTEKGTKSIRFNISGEVTEYQGKNFLIIRFVKTERDMNQGFN